MCSRRYPEAVRYAYQVSNFMAVSSLKEQLIGPLEKATYQSWVCYLLGGGIQTLGKMRGSDIGQISLKVSLEVDLDLDRELPNQYLWSLLSPFLSGGRSAVFSFTVKTPFSRIT